MALVIVSGLPSSGRSTRVHELIADWEQRLSASSSSSSPAHPTRIVHLADSSVHLSKSTYASQLAEKPARASFLSLVQRSLVKDAIVVADGGAGLNIKGFRYQLWCAAREVGLTCISVFVNTRREKCAEWNRKRREAGHEAYDDQTLEDLCMRYEEPNPMTRWDSPLFVLTTETFGEGQASLPRPPGSSSDASAPWPMEAWEPAPFDRIWEAITRGKVSKAPSVVVQNRTTSTNYLSFLEGSSQALVAALQPALLLLGAESTSTSAHTLTLTPTLPSSHPPRTANIALTLPDEYATGEKKLPTPAQLQRLRRQFVKIHSTSFATGNVLGKTAKEEGGGGGSSSARRAGQSGAAQSEVKRGPALTLSRGPKLGGAARNRAEDVTQQRHGDASADTTIPTSVPSQEDAKNGSDTHPLPAAADGTDLEETIMRRFAVWLGEILGSSS